MKTDSERHDLPHPSLSDLEDVRIRCDQGAFDCWRDYDIAATCIRIVSDLVRCTAPKDGKAGYQVKYNEDTTFDIAGPTGWEIAENILWKEDADHLSELHNMWVRAVESFDTKEDNENERTEEK